MPNIFLISESVAPKAPDVDIAVGFGMAFTVLGITAFIAAVHMREKNRERLSTKVKIALAGLTENAFLELGRLREEIDSILPHPNDPFDPLSMTKDPSSVIRPAKLSVRLLKERDMISKNFDLILSACSIIKYSLFLFALSCGLATASYWLNYGDQLQWTIMTWLSIAIGTIVALTFLWFAFLDQRIQRGIEDGVVSEPDEIRGTQ